MNYSPEPPLSFLVVFRTILPQRVVLNLFLCLCAGEGRGCWGCDVDTHIKIHIRDLFSDIYIKLLQVLTFFDVCRQFRISKLCLQWFFE